MARFIGQILQRPGQAMAAFLLPFGLAIGGAGIGSGGVGRVSAAPAPMVIDGYASVVDGATIDLMGERIRIADLSVPALGETCAGGTDCGLAAALDLRRLVGWQKISCTARGRDTGGRLLADCRYGDRDVATQMRVRGWGV
ncbi:MAG: thermonuclease family protein [Zavarzinia sp.]|nr:thermonuclease family protein [Zavarzinia sp.]